MRSDFIKGGTGAAVLGMGLCLGMLLLPAGAPAAADEVTVSTHLLYEITDGFYAEAGKDAVFVKGETGVLERNGQEPARVEVVSVSSGSAFLRFIGPRPRSLPRPGEIITLILNRSPALPESSSPRKPSSTLKDRGADDSAVSLPQGKVDAPSIEDPANPGQPAKPAAQGNGSPFVPLLASEKDKTRIGAFTDAYNIFKGQLSLREIFQVTPGEDLDYSLTRLRSSGSVERIRATPWAFEYSGDISYRDGPALEDVQDFNEVRLEFYRLAFFRKFDNLSWVRLGRFLPRELPSVGYLDGIHGEYAWNEYFRIGSMLGLKPKRHGLDFSVDEPTYVGYVTVQAGDLKEVNYTGTLGLLTSLYKGRFDRLALLGEQTLRWDDLTVISSSEFDFDVGGAEVRDGPQVTRFDFLASYPIFSHTTLRAGLDRYELPDTAAEADEVPSLVLQEEEFFNRGYWRYFIGASHDLPWKLRLSEEASLMDSEFDEWTFRWNVSLTKTSLPFLSSSSSMTLTVYNLESEDFHGYGGRLSAYVPLPGNQFSLQPDLGFRFANSDLDGENTFTVADASLRAYWYINKSWSASGGVGYTFTREVDRIFVDLGITFKW